jgi:hypothetical protein
MKNLNTYINEGLADWGEDKTLNKKMSKQTTKAAIKKEIIDWAITNSVGRIFKNRFTFDFNTTPITVNYDGNYSLNPYTDSLTNGLFQWGEINGSFEVKYNKKITSLEGAPKKVRYDFSCRDCSSLESLEGGPQEVGRNYVCSCCTSLKSLKGCPEEIDDRFYCDGCTGITTLEGCPKKIGTSLRCIECTSLKSLKGCPEEIPSIFDCSQCTSLTTLKYGPKKVNGYYCGGTNIESLEGTPDIMREGIFHCKDCVNLKSLKGCPSMLYSLNIQGCTNLKSLDDLPETKSCRIYVDDINKFDKVPKNYELR